MAKTFLSIIFLLTLSLTASATNAQMLISGELADDLDKQSIEFYDKSGLEGSRIEDIASAVLLTFFSVLGVVFTSLIVYGGYVWMTAQGNEEKITKAKSTMRGAIWGLIFVVASYSIAFFLLRFIVGSVIGSDAGPSAGG